MAQLGKGPTYLPVGECWGVSTGNKERERTACGVKNVPCRQPAAEDTMARPVHHCGGHASCLGDSRFFSWAPWAPLAEGDSKASTTRPSGSSVQLGLAFTEYCRSPSLLCFLPRFSKGVSPNKILHNNP